MKDKVASLQMSKANTSLHFFSSDVGVKSSGDVFMFLMTVSVSLPVTWRHCCSNSAADLGTDAEIFELLSDIQ
jgi:hypothetical protein